MSAPKISVLVFASVLVLNMRSTTRAQSTRQDYLDAHNVARWAVGVANISWDTAVQAYAEDYAKQRIEDCSLVHSNGPYGKNIFSGTSMGYSGIDAVSDWVAEQQYYDYGTNTCALGEMCGHYTQVVWRNTTQVGCARVKCDNNAGVFIICSYRPAGNVDGEWPY